MIAEVGYLGAEDRPLSKQTLNESGVSTYMYTTDCVIFNFNKSQHIFFNDRQGPDGNSFRKKQFQEIPHSPNEIQVSSKPCFDLSLMYADK